MAVIKCNNGHFYDDAKFEVCPHCAKERNGNALDFADEKTVAKISRDKAMEDLTQYIGTDGDEKTISIFTKRAGADPVVGWLVCEDGAEKGRDYRIHSGRNFVGRVDKMDVVVKDDPEITREDHCSVVYDPKTGSFMLAPGHGTITFLNGEHLGQPKEVCEGDVIEIGSSKFVFIPFCKGGRKWLRTE